MAIHTPRTDMRYRQLGYSTELESTALRHLDQFDAEGCRSRLGRLVADLRVDGPPGEARRARALILDLLLTVNRRIRRFRLHDAGEKDRRLELIDEFSGSIPAAEIRERFLAALNRLLSPVAAGTDDGNPLVLRAREHIDANYRRRICLSSVAESLNVSPNYLSRLFRKEVGSTLTEYVQRLRVADARRLLANGNRSISEIAYQVGYQNYRDFYRNFVRREKASPREVRRRLNARLA